MFEQKSYQSIVIIGPTASGKSAIAIDVAKKFDGEIISSDSRQIYRHMDIGTGKVPRDTVMNRHAYSLQKNNLPYFSNDIPHWMIDIVEPSTIYNAGKFQKKASKVQEDILKRNKFPIICGGTGFWTQSLVENINLPEVLPNLKLRKDLENLSTKELHTKLLGKDPVRAKQLPEKNRVHLIRALEICEAIGNVPALNSRKTPTTSPGISPLRSASVEMTDQSIDYLIIAIDISKEILHKKIEKRFELWLTDGFLDEIYDLHHKYRVTWKRIENFGLEYKWGSRYIRGKITEQDFRENTIRDLKRYAKRQLTWIRRWKRQGQKIYWLSNQKEIEKLVERFL